MSSSRKKIILFNNNTFPPGFVSKIKRNFKNFNFIILKDHEFKKLNNQLESSNALINCPRKYFNEKLVKRFTNMDWVHTSAAGVDAFINPLFSNLEVCFTNGKILQGPEVADHAIGIILSFSRNIHHYYKNPNIKNIKRPIELFKKKALIVGFGGIGRCISERLTGFGMVIDVIAEELPALTNEVNSFFSIQRLNKISKNYDVIISAAPLTLKTKKIFDYEFFKSMKKNSIFVNISRGKLVDTKALQKKNIHKKFLGLGLDVTYPEPLPKNHFLRKLPNVILTNHSAGLSDNNRLRAYELMYENLSRYYNNQTLLNRVDKIEGY